MSIEDIKQIMDGFDPAALLPDLSTLEGKAELICRIAVLVGPVLLLAVGIGLFALSTILSWSLYGSRCFEYLFGGKGVRYYQIIFVLVTVVGATLKLDLVWNIADTLNGFMALPNLIALLGLSGVVIKLTKDHFNQDKLDK